MLLRLRLRGLLGALCPDPEGVCLGLCEVVLGGLTCLLLLAARADLSRESIVSCGLTKTSSFPRSCPELLPAVLSFPLSALNVLGLLPFLWVLSSVKLDLGVELSESHLVVLFQLGCKNHYGIT